MIVDVVVRGSHLTAIKFVKGFILILRLIIEKENGVLSQVLLGPILGIEWDLWLTLVGSVPQNPQRARKWKKKQESPGHCARTCSAWLLQSEYRKSRRTFYTEVPILANTNHMVDASSSCEHIQLMITPVNECAIARSQDEIRCGCVVLLFVLSIRLRDNPESNFASSNCSAQASWKPRLNERPEKAKVWQDAQFLKVLKMLKMLKRKTDMPVKESTF
ncbi:hypothetical protein EI94DRAFT_1702428 [Lactarius quietus]|nr:hypothetical protein EI94DRAFT_1702428 [Lactarius quietus]